METEHQNGVQKRCVRCTPFIAVVLCFLLPFFSLSSCAAGTDTDASGFDIVVGAKLIKQQTSQPLYLVPDDGSGSPPPMPDVQLGPIGPDPEAQAVLRRARLWTVLALTLAVLGGCTAAALDRLRRPVVATVATAASVALILAGVAMTGGPPVQDGVSIEKGMILAIVILLGTAIWQLGAMIRSAGRMAAPRPVTAGPHD
jgi:hypothetical protein